jgi:hypothetical protein
MIKFWIKVGEVSSNNWDRPRYNWPSLFNIVLPSIKQLQYTNGNPLGAGLDEH